MFESKITQERLLKGIIIVAIFVGIVLLLRYLSGVLMPFVAALLIAYLLRPIVCFFERSRTFFAIEYLFGLITYKVKNLFKKKDAETTPAPTMWKRATADKDEAGKIVYPACSSARRVPAVFITLIIVIALFVMACLLLIPPMVEQGESLSRLITSYVQNKAQNTVLPDFVNEQIQSMLVSVDVKSLLMDANVLGVAKSLAQSTWGVVSQSLGVIMGFISSLISVLYLIFIMIDYEKVTNRILNLIPQGDSNYRSKSYSILKKVETNMSKYFQAQALIATIVGILFAIGFSIINLPMAIGLGLMIGLLNMVPYLQTIGLIPSLLFATLQALESGNDVLWAIIAVLAVFIVVQTIQDTILTPKIMGTKFDMSPAIMLLSLSIWGSVLGFIGLIIAIPLADLVRQAYDVLVLNKEKEAEPTTALP